MSPKKRNFGNLAFMFYNFHRYKISEKIQTRKKINPDLKSFLQNVLSMCLDEVDINNSCSL